MLVAGSDVRLNSTASFLLRGVRSRVTRKRYHIEFEVPVYGQQSVVERESPDFADKGNRIPWDIAI
jgi:hypothetical protein